MWIVDTRVEGPREAESAYPGGHRRRRLHGPGPDQPDRAQHSLACGWWRYPTGRVERAVEVFRYAGCEDVVVAETQREFDDAAFRLQPVVDRGCDAPRAVGAYRRARRCHRFGRVRRACGAGGIQARQGRRADERRARCHHRADPADICRSAWRDSDRLRGRRAGCADEPVPLGEGARPDAARCSATSRGCRIPTAIRRRSRASPSAGGRIRRW